jgi:hypothetical protein
MTRRSAANPGSRLHIWGTSWLSVGARVAIRYTLRWDRRPTRAPVAQLDRALGCGPKGRGFKSLRAYHIIFLRYPPCDRRSYAGGITVALPPLAFAIL